MGTKKRVFSSHAKSSAVVISLVVHAILIVVAFSFVAVTVIQKADKSFEAKPVSRPKMEMKKLQVPVNVKKKKPKPKLRKRILAQPKMNQNMPDIKMPEISGIKGGLGNAGGDGIGGAAAVGFSMPEIEIFGIKGKGEKIVLALGAGADMMADKMGGIEAYTIIKDELIRIVEELPPTALFNVLIYDWKRGSSNFSGREVALAFPTMVSANDANKKKLTDWIAPLNAVSKGMGENAYGLHTLGKGGVLNNDEMLIGKFSDTKKVRGVGRVAVRNWYRSAMLAQKMRADTIFILTDKWDYQRVPSSLKGMSREEWDQTSPGKKWNDAYKQALKTLDEEQKRRKEAGEAPKVIERNEYALKKEYYPDIEKPPANVFYNYTPKDFVEAFVLTREKYKSNSVQTTSGIKRKKSKKIDFSYNVIQFVPQGESAKEKDANNFKQLTSLCNGDYKTISGLSEIQIYVTAPKVK